MKDQLYTILRNEDAAVAEGGADDGGSAAVAEAPAAALGDGIAPSEVKIESTPQVFESLKATLPDDILATPTIQNTKDFEGMAKQLVESQKMIGKKTLAEPQEDWTPEQWGELYGKLGRPETPDEYPTAEALAPNLPEGVELNDDALKVWNEVFHSTGLNKQQSTPLIEHFAKQVKAEQEAAQAAEAEYIATNIGNLKNKWGDNYEANIDGAQQVFEQVAPEQLKALVASDPKIRNNEGFLELMHTLAQESQNANQRTGGASRAFVAGSPAAAKAELAQFNEQHAELLNSAPEKLSYPDKIKREELLAYRTKIYQQIYQEES